MVHAALNVPSDDVGRAGNVTLNGKFKQKSMVIDNRLSAKTLGQHMVAEKAVEDG
jgi:hypothetical protein